MTSVPQDGVRTFLPPGHLAMTKPAITRPARHSYYTSETAQNLDLFAAEMKLTIRAMQIREAKDFLVAQTAEQAALEGVPLSDLEKRMMYFTESGYVPEDPIKLNEEFEAECDTAQYMRPKFHGSSITAINVCEKRTTQLAGTGILLSNICAAATTICW
jgi:hypothetical protein